MTKEELTALADRLESFNEWRRGKEPPGYDPEPFQIGLDIDAAIRVIRAYDNQSIELAKLSKALADIAPWLSASLELMTPCQEYRDACEQIFRLDSNLT